MLKNHLTLAYRHLRKSKTFSLITIFGLAVGMAAAWLILQHVHFELSYERWNERADQVYRVQHDRYADGELKY